MSTSFPNVVDLEFVQITMFEKYAHLVVKEGVTLDSPKIDALFEILNSYYSDRSFGYISDRQFDFSVNPNCYKEVSKYENLKSIAVLCHKESTYNSANFEKTFYDRPFAPFFTLEECEKYVTSYL